ncbi:hypothetical protein [Nostoc sp.]|uniref:hypothetical protein n=1 Tax=Nostoc sp. TaxID=1180 RepID=UPI002FF7DE2B
MTTTIRELLEDVKHYPLETVVVIKDVDDQEFAIVAFKLENHTLSIVIGEKVEESEEAEAA